jgi:DNA-binding winged helix-turn-helix (wHTH) protein/TolB-like protein
MHVTQPPDDTRRWYRFGTFEFDRHTLELTKVGRSVALRPQALKLLAVLLSRPGELVAREVLQRELWGNDTFVDFEQGVNHAIRELRAALGDSADSPRFIQTLPRRGYRFIAPLAQVDDSPGTSRDVPVSVAAPSVSVAATATRTRSRMALAMAGVAAVAIVTGAWLTSRAGVGPARDAAALTVRPFVTAEDPAFGVGLASAIAIRLGGQQTLAVRSDWPQGASDTSRAEPSASQQATLVLDGNMTTNGPDVHVVARLRDTSGTTVWSEQIRVRADELFSLEDVIAERVASTLRLRLAATEQDRLRRRYTENTAAYSHYLRGRSALVRYTPEGTRTAIEAFETALTTDPAYVLARAGLAMACAEMYLRFAPAGEVDAWGERAEAEARAALDLDSDLAEAHLARAAVARKREFDWNATVTSSRRALALNPNLDQARFFVAGAYYHHGYMQEALIEMEKGRSVHGVDAIEPIRIEALVALFSGDFAPAQARLAEVSRLTSQPIGDTYLALAYYYTGSSERARRMLEALAASRSASTSARAGAALAGVEAARGHNAEARRLIERVVRGLYRDHHVAYSLGAAFAQLGEHHEAARWLRTAADTGFPCPPFFERDPLLEPFRRGPAFADLLTYVRTRRAASLSAVNR